MSHAYTIIALVFILSGSVFLGDALFGTPPSNYCGVAGYPPCQTSAASSSTTAITTQVGSVTTVTTTTLYYSTVCYGGGGTGGLSVVTTTQTQIATTTITINCYPSPTSTTTSSTCFYGACATTTTTTLQPITLSVSINAPGATFYNNAQVGSVIPYLVVDSEILYQPSGSVVVTPGVSHYLSAISSFIDAYGNTWTFQSWSDGGAAGHLISPTQSTSYKANYYLSSGICQTNPQYCANGNTGGLSVVRQSVFSGYLGPASTGISYELAMGGTFVAIGVAVAIFAARGKILAQG